MEWSGVYDQRWEVFEPAQLSWKRCAECVCLCLCVCTRLRDKGASACEVAAILSARRGQGGKEKYTEAGGRSTRVLV